MKSDSALTVSQLNLYLKMLLESDSRLKRVCVVGEISNFVNHYKTGHFYFSLKDSSCTVKVVMFAKNASRLRFVPENGMRVYITGRVSLFERDGVYQIYAEDMEPEGAGALMLAFEQLKMKLSAEGLFDEEKKRPLPPYPNKIAVITSPVGAAVRDVVNVLSRRYPLAEMVFCPVAVQGVSCAEENIRAIRLLNERHDIDVIILCRGGGSVEDLWGYNDEGLVRAVASSRIPIITGIGHEVDYTLCDFAADMRAPTPSAAAEQATPEREELLQLLDGLIFRLDHATVNRLTERNNTLKNLTARLKIFDPRKTLERQMADTKVLIDRLHKAAETYFLWEENALRVFSEKIRLLNPYNMIENGYIPVFCEERRVMRAVDLSPGDAVTLSFLDGSVRCDVREIAKEESTT